MEGQGAGRAVFRMAPPRPHLSRTPATRLRAHVWTGPRHDHLDGRHADLDAIPGYNPGPVGTGARVRFGGDRGGEMRLCIRILGLDLLDVEMTTDSPSPEPEDDDIERDLSGGYLGSLQCDDGPTDRYMGFTNGREVE